MRPAQGRDPLARILPETTSMMKRIDFLFAVTGIIFLAAGTLFFQSDLDINIHDTYIVLPKWQIAIGLSCILFFISLIYFSFDKFGRPLKVKMGLAHYILTVLSLLIFIFPPTFLFAATRYRPGADPFQSDFDINTFLVFVFFILFFGQILFIINIVRTIIGRKTTR